VQEHRADPAIVDMNGSTTVIANAVATAASTACRLALRHPAATAVRAEQVLRGQYAVRGRCGPLGDDQARLFTGLSSREAASGADRVLRDVDDRASSM